MYYLFISQRKIFQDKLQKRLHGNLVEWHSAPKLNKNDTPLLEVGGKSTNNSCCNYNVNDQALTMVSQASLVNVTAIFQQPFWDLDTISLESSHNIKVMILTKWWMEQYSLKHDEWSFFG